MSPRTCVRLKGGLGNQMFQWAAALAIQSRPEVFDYGEKWKPGHPGLGDFDVEIEYPRRWQRTTIPGLTVNESWRDEVSDSIAQALRFAQQWTVVEQRNPFAPKPNDLSGRIFLNGWFQHPSWWEESWALAAERIGQRAPVRFEDRERVAIKVRRSDYIEAGWALPEEYFDEALAALGVSDCEVVVLGEDLEARRFLEGPLRRAKCSVAEAPTLTGDRNLDDFWTLAGASRIVQANSSYSWWACAVATLWNPDVQVVYPRPWMPNQWNEGSLPDMGLPAWQAAASGFGDPP